MTDAIGTSYQYAFHENDTLKQMIADYEGITPDHILLGAGSSPLLMAAAIYFTRKGGNIITCDPTFRFIANRGRSFAGQMDKSASHFKTINLTLMR